jgi:hypothetical protein
MKFGQVRKQEKISSQRLGAGSRTDCYVRVCRMRAGCSIHYHLVAEFPSANP